MTSEKPVFGFPQKTGYPFSAHLLEHILSEKRLSVFRIIY